MLMLEPNSLISCCSCPVYAFPSLLNEEGARGGVFLSKSMQTKILFLFKDLSTWKMFSQAPIVVAARGTGLLNMVSSFNASVLISVMLFCIVWNLITHFTKNQNQLKRGKNGGSTTKSIIYQSSKGKWKRECTSKHHDHSKLQCQLQKICRWILSLISQRNGQSPKPHGCLKERTRKWTYTVLISKCTNHTSYSVNIKSTSQHYHWEN